METTTETRGSHIALKRTSNAAMIASVPSILVFISFSLLLSNLNGHNQFIQNCKRWRKIIGGLVVQLVELLGQNGPPVSKWVVVRVTAF
jgi:hypothetical protein